MPGTYCFLTVGILVALAEFAAPERISSTAGQIPAPQRSTPPTWKECLVVVEKSLRARREDFQPADLLSAGDVDAVVQSLAAAGWKSPMFPRIQKLALPEQHFLVEQFRGKHGKAFMRRVSQLPLVYDRLDRLCRYEYGCQTIRDLIHGPDGHKLLEYYTSTAQQGNVLTEILPKDETGFSPQGKEFDQPTGRIYTSDHLLEVLKAAYLQDTAPETPVKKRPRGPKVYQVR